VAPQYPTVIDGKSTNTMLEPRSSFKITCSGVRYDGTVASAGKTLALNAAYEGCAYGTSPVKVDMHSCYYVLHVLNAGPPYTGQADVACGSEGDVILVTVYLTKETEKEGKSLCTYKIGAQSGLKGLDLDPFGLGYGLEAVFHLEGLSSTREGSILCGSTTGSTGKYSGSTTLYGSP
jgi:hypothetical protein